LPLSAPQARGKALVNLLPLTDGERITTIMPLPEDEAAWETLDVMFATTSGSVRRNKLSDSPRSTAPARSRCGSTRRANRRYPDLRRGGRCALDDRNGQCIRFSVTEVRSSKARFHGRARIALGNGDRVISLAICAIPKPIAASVSLISGCAARLQAMFARA